MARVAVAVALVATSVVAGPAAQAEPFMDFGDAPDTYCTTFAAAACSDGGARHGGGESIGAPMLGSRIDSEDGSALAGPFDGTGDDVNGACPGFCESVGGPGDDEDGVTVPALVVGATSTFVVTVADAFGAVTLSYFVDWNRNGTFADAGESYTQTVTDGSNDVIVAVPATATPGASYARFRVAFGALTFSGSSFDGEVEDYAVTIAGEAPPPVDPCTGVVVLDVSSGSRASAVTAPGSNGLVAAASVCGLIAIEPNVNGTRSTLLATTPTDAEPQVSPDGTKIAFVNAGNVFMLDFPKGSDRVQVTTAGGFFAPSWSPDSGTLVFASEAGLHTAPAVSNGPVSIVTGSAPGDDNPDYSPDGSFIVFDSEVPPSGILRLGAGGSARTLLTGTVAGDNDPHVSPGGNVVYFASEAGISVLPWPAGGGRSLRPGTIPGDTEPFASPDGTKVGFTDGSLATVNSNGSGGRSALLGTAATDTSGSWATANGASVGSIQFTSESACGSASMLTLFPPSAIRVSATNSLPGHGVALSSSGLPSYVAFDPATGALTLVSDLTQLLPLVIAVITNAAGGLIGFISSVPGIGPLLTALFGPLIALLAPPTVTITASDTVAPGASPATCTKLVRVSLFGIV